MPLIDLKTSLKSLKFGKDRPYGGSSNQPYIQTSIPEGENSGVFQTGGIDSILRGGILAPISAAKDVSRLTQMFFDLKSPNGSLFTVKQNLLSKASVETEASNGASYALGLNQGIYLPSSTIAQAGVGFLGTHLNLFGIAPIDGSPLSIIKYEDVVKEANKLENNKSETISITPNSSPLSRQSSPFLNRNNNFVPSLSTNNSPFSSNSNFSFSTPDIKSPGPFNEIKVIPANFSNRLLKFWDESQISKNESGNLYSYSGGPGSTLGFGNTNIKISTQRTNINTQREGNFTLNNSTSTLKSFYYTPEQIASQPLNLDSTVYEDFRKTLIDSNNINESSVLSISPSYLRKTIELRNHLGNPGKRKNVYNYGVKATDLEALDKINALPMYDDEGPNNNYATNDLVKFRIAAINNDGNGKKAVYMHFRAFIDSFNDNYNATWNPIKYSGRGDTLYNYQGFERSINLSFTVYAQSKAELIPMYRKLNYLASTLAPDYTEAGFMRGNLLRLTLGGYLYEQPGFITSLTYTIPEESTWEIGIDEKGGYDASVKELPHMIKVTGMTFTPIHDFLPQKPNSDSAIRREKGTYSPISEKYIALAAGNLSSTEYTNYGDYYTYYDASNARTSDDASTGAPVAQPLTTDNVGVNSVTPSSNALNIPNSPNSFFS